VPALYFIVRIVRNCIRYCVNRMQGTVYGTVWTECKELYTVLCGQNARNCIRCCVDRMQNFDLKVWSKVQYFHFFHSRTVHLDIIKCFIIQLNAQLDYSRLKLTLKFTLKCSYMFWLTNDRQGAYCCALLKLWLLYLRLLMSYIYIYIWH
jgi:hypothetical protein